MAAITFDAYVAATRKIVVDEAMSWRGTPYKHSCLQKGRGADCARFAIWPYKIAGLVPMSVKVPIEGRDRLLAGDQIDPDQFRDFILQYANEVPFDDRQPADMITFMFLGVETHVAIISDVDPDFIIDCPTRSMVRKRPLSKIPSIVGVYRPKAFCNVDTVTVGA